MDIDTDIFDPKEIWRRINGQVHPVVLRSENKEYPYHGVGTAFILEHKSELYVVSAQHVLDSQTAKSDEFTILLREAGYALIFDFEAIFQPDYEPHYDLLIRRIAPFQREFLIEQGLYWIGTELTIDPQHHSNVSLFLVFGYSEDDREYDYDSKRISAYLSCLSAKLINPNIQEMVSLQVSRPYPNSMRGLSGSLVVAVIDGEWMFAGMLTLAVESTGVMNFIPAHRILGYLQQTEEMMQFNDTNIAKNVIKT